MVQMLIDEGTPLHRCGFPLQGKQRIQVNLVGFPQRFVGKIEPALQVYVLPAHGRRTGKRSGRFLPLGGGHLQQWPSCGPLSSSPGLGGSLSLASGPLSKATLAFSAK